MSDWQVGDLAVCVDATPDILGNPVPLKEGVVYLVSGITPAGIASKYGRTNRLSGLALKGVPNKWPCGWAPERFRKIRPDAQEACEPEFITLLKRKKVAA